MADKKYVMVIDLKLCIGCHTCAIACKQGNNLPNEVWWNRVMTFGGPTMDTPHGVFPNLKMSFLTLNCQHCDDPPCVKACPAEATYKREDGLVMQDYDTCLGCRMCIMACPYNDVRTYNENHPQYYLDFPVGDQSAKEQQKGTVSKCTFCYHRLDAGLSPNCIEVCPVRARSFGDIADSDSDVSKLLEARTHTQLLADKGTKPSVFYLI
ncbi:MAG: 4Fe-4S dicluster domain-containing protein [Proteobacteria bacterium]|nr:4Fe-4S dicluster domain-containing protein [Pseudomonadota bacterium]